MRLEADEDSNYTLPSLAFKEAANGEFCIGTSLHVSHIFSQKPLDWLDCGNLHRIGIVRVFDFAVYNLAKEGCRDRPKNKYWRKR